MRDKVMQLSAASVMLLSALWAGNTNAQQSTECIDNDGDGWGWIEATQSSCLIADQPTATLPTAPVPEVPSSADNQCIDTDGDGWGWIEAEQMSCFLGASVVQEQAPAPAPAPDPVMHPCVDFDGDGYGWNGVETCFLPETEPAMTELIEDLFPVEEPVPVMMPPQDQPIVEIPAAPMQGPVIPVLPEPDPEPVVVVVPEPEPEPVVVAVAPEPEPVIVPEPAPEPEPAPAFDPDGPTIFTTRAVNPGSRNPNPRVYRDSYSVGNRCYTLPGLDHGVSTTVVDTPFGRMTVAEVANLIGPGPGLGNNPVYNDVQCGNGPPNNFGDEDAGVCPGRVDQGRAGCGIIGPTWYFGDLL